MGRLDITPLFSNLGELREHICPGYPYVIKSCEPMIMCCHAYEECMRYCVSVRDDILLASTGLRTNSAYGDPWERFMVLWETISSDIKWEEVMRT